MKHNYFHHKIIVFTTSYLMGLGAFYSAYEEGKNCLSNYWDNFFEVYFHHFFNTCRIDIKSTISFISDTSWMQKNYWTSQSLITISSENFKAATYEDFL
tara:strand:+ start:372556 stop:372852 length:297 start_codon:yes stop_codon:yes gene_type:complete